MFGVCYSCTCPQCGVILLNGICINCIYGDGKPVTCCECEGPLRGGFCLFCNSKAENSFTYDPNAYYFNDTSSNFNHLPQPQYETYLCELCGNNSHYGYDCQQQFPFVYEQEPSYNQNYNEDTNELFQKLLEDLQIISEELVEYINSPSWNRPTFYDDDEEHSIQYKEYLEKSPDAIAPEYEDTSDDESECDVPVKDESSSVFTTFSNPIFDENDDFTSSDDESLSSEEDVPLEEFKVYSNPLFDDKEINSDKVDPHCFNSEYDFIEFLSKHDTLIDSSSKFDYLEEISVELMPTAINSFPRPLEKFQANKIIETLPTSTIPVEDSDSLKEEIDIFTSMDDLTPPGIESDYYDSEGDINFLEKLLANDSIPFPKNKSSDFDNQDDPSFPCPPLDAPDIEFFFDLEPDLISVVKNNIDKLNEDECFDPGGEINVFANVKMKITFPSYLSFEFFYRISSTLRFLLYFSPLGVNTSFLTLVSLFRVGGISLGWNFHVL
nr:hypothetical protein [Tanacetum cinerariifolium]